METWDEGAGIPRGTRTHPTLPQFPTLVATRSHDYAITRTHPTLPQFLALVPTLCVGTPPRTLRVPLPAGNTFTIPRSFHEPGNQFPYLFPFKLRFPLFHEGSEPFNGIL